LRQDGSSGGIGSGRANGFGDSLPRDGSVGVLAVGGNTGGASAAGGNTGGDALGGKMGWCLPPGWAAHLLLTLPHIIYVYLSIYLSIKTSVYLAIFIAD